MAPVCAGLDMATADRPVVNQQARVNQPATLHMLVSYFLPNSGSKVLFQPSRSFMDWWTHGFTGGRGERGETIDWSDTLCSVVCYDEDIVQMPHRAHSERDAITDDCTLSQRRRQPAPSLKISANHSMPSLTPSQASESISGSAMCNQTDFGPSEGLEGPRASSKVLSTSNVVAWRFPGGRSPSRSPTKAGSAGRVQAAQGQGCSLSMRPGKQAEGVLELKERMRSKRGAADYLEQCVEHDKEIEQQLEEAQKQLAISRTSVEYMQMLHDSAAVAKHHETYVDLKKAKDHFEELQKKEDRLNRKLFLIGQEVDAVARDMDTQADSTQKMIVLDFEIKRQRKRLDVLDAMQADLNNMREHGMNRRLLQKLMHRKRDLLAEISKVQQHITDMEAAKNEFARSGELSTAKFWRSQGWGGSGLVEPVDVAEERMDTISISAEFSQVLSSLKSFSKSAALQGHGPEKTPRACFASASPVRRARSVDSQSQSRSQWGSQEQVSQFANTMLSWERIERSMHLDEDCASVSHAGWMI